MEKRKVMTIPATVSRFTASPMAMPKKRKVAAYARVSTDSDEQFTSYAAQIDYYTQYIKARDDWEFISVYTDEEPPYPAQNKPARHHEDDGQVAEHILYESFLEATMKDTFLQFVVHDSEFL